QAAIASLERQFSSLGNAVKRVQSQFAPAKAGVAGIGNAATPAAAKVDALGNAIDRANRKSKGLIGSLTSMRGALLTTMGALGVGALVTMSDEYTNVENKLRLVTTGTANLKAVNDALF